MEEDETSCRELILNWLIAHREDKTGFHQITPPDEFSKEKLPISFLPSLIYQDLVEKKKDVKKANQNILFYPFPRLYKNEIIWLAPIRSKPKRTYDSYRSDYSPEGEHTPYIIKNILVNQKDKKV